MAYPSVAQLGLRVERIGRSSVEYEVGIFEADEIEVRAVARLVHVFVEVETGKPSPEGLSSPLRTKLNTIFLVHGSYGDSKL
jgi:acyl-CoA thioester hydrolase